MSALVRAHITWSDGCLWYNGQLREVALLPDRLVIDQRAATGDTTRMPLRTATSRGTTSALVASKTAPVDFASKWPAMTLPWKRVLRWVWTSTRDRHVNDFLYKLIHRRLPLGYRRYWDPQLEVGCPCGGALETLEHLFGVCPIARSVWTWFFSAWRRATDIRLVASPRHVFFASLPPAHLRRNNAPLYKLLSIAHTEALYSIWLCRNRYVFDDDPYEPVVIKALALSRILAACQAASSLHHLPGYTAVFDALYSALQDSVTG
jgi:hypothetical protein